MEAACLKQEPFKCNFIGQGIPFLDQAMKLDDVFTAPAENESVEACQVDSWG